MIAPSNIYITTVSYLADTYGSGTYSTGTYNCSSATSTCGRPASGSLVNTGVAVGLFVGVAALVIVVAVLVRVWRRPGKRDENTSDQA